MYKVLLEICDRLRLKKKKLSVVSICSLFSGIADKKGPERSHTCCSVWWDSAENRIFALRPQWPPLMLRKKALGDVQLRVFGCFMSRL